jgi:hypothetical protein
MKRVCSILKHLGPAQVEFVAISRLTPQTTPIHYNLQARQIPSFKHHSLSSRAFSAHRWLLNEAKGSSIESKSNISNRGRSKESDPLVHHAPEEDLPSHREAQRWTTSKRIHALMDDLMQRLSVASQRINKYTGTDYTGIEALRREIKDQG